MVSRLLLSTICVTSALVATKAVAADLDPSYADVPPPIAEQQVTFGSGWYVRGDIAATDIYKVGLQRTSLTNYNFDLTHSQDAGYDLSLGGGYAFTNSIRADITADFHQPTQAIYNNEQCITLSTSTCQFDGRFSHYDALINGYYDFSKWAFVTPYLGVGVGVGFGNVSTKLTGDSDSYVGNTGYHSFAWALMAGVAFDVYNHVKLDVGYRYLNEGTAFNSKLYNHEIRAGLRYMIDN